MKIAEQAIPLIITGVLLVLLVVALYASLTISFAKTEKSKLEVNWSKQGDKVMLGSNAARGCIITEDVGKMILWRCPTIK